MENIKSHLVKKTKLLKSNSIDLPKLEARLLLALMVLWSMAGLFILGSASWWVASKEMGDGSYFINVYASKGFFAKIINTVSNSNTYQLLVKQIDESNSEVIFIDLSEENEQDTIDYSFDFFNELAAKF